MFLVGVTPLRGAFWFRPCFALRENLRPSTFASFRADGRQTCKPAIAGRIEFKALFRNCLRALSAVFRDCRLVTSSRPRVRRPAHAGQTLRSDGRSAHVERQRPGLLRRCFGHLSPVFARPIARLAGVRSMAISAGRRPIGCDLCPLFRALCVLFTGSPGGGSRWGPPTGRPPIVRPIALSTCPQIFHPKNGP